MLWPKRGGVRSGNCSLTKFTAQISCVKCKPLPGVAWLRCPKHGALVKRQAGNAPPAALHVAPGTTRAVPQPHPHLCTSNLNVGTNTKNSRRLQRKIFILLRAISELATHFRTTFLGLFRKKPVKHTCRHVGGLGPARPPQSTIFSWLPLNTTSPPIKQNKHEKSGILNFNFVDSNLDPQSFNGQEKKGLAICHWHA